MAFGATQTTCELFCPVPTLCGYVVDEEITQVWNLEYVALSFVVSFCGAFSSLAIVSNLKVCVERSWYWIFLGTAGLSVGLNTVWCMHFVGMHAIRLDGGKASGAQGSIPMRFEPALTILSLAACWVCATAGLYMVVGGDGMKLKALSKRALIRLLGGAHCLAAGVLVMHYCGMRSQRGPFRMIFRPGIIVATTPVAIVVAAAGLALLLFFGNTLIMRVVSGLIVAVAVSAVHYIGMLSATYYVSEAGDVGNAWAIDSSAVAHASFILNLVLYVICDTYGEELRLKAEAARRRVEELLIQREAQQKREQTLKRQLADAVESVQELGHPLFLVPAQDFLDLTLEQVAALHEEYRESGAGKLKILDCMSDVRAFKESGAQIVFFSYECLQWSRVGPNAAQFEAMVQSVQELSVNAKRGAGLAPLFVWLDCLCIPQKNKKMTAAAVSCVYTFARIPDHMVIICPDSRHQDTGRVADAYTVRRRMWCRLEQVAYGCSMGIHNMWLHRGAGLEPLPRDWMDTVCSVHDADSTCCRLRHTTMKRCDKEKAVVPLLAMYYDVYSRWVSPLSERDEALKFAWELMSRRQEDMFPEYYQYSTEEGSEQRLLFGDLIARVQQLVQKEHDEGRFAGSGPLKAVRFTPPPKEGGEVNELREASTSEFPGPQGLVHEPRSSDAEGGDQFPPGHHWAVQSIETCFL